MIHINGIAHTALSVTDVSRSRRFYEPLLSFLGLTCVANGEGGFYFVGGRTGVAIQACPEGHAKSRFEQGAVGLHHLCFRARSREDVDAVHEFLVEHGATIVSPAKDGPWAPGYYYVLFEDPDGIRLEVNHVPGKGLFAQGASFNPVDYDMTPAKE